MLMQGQAIRVAAIEAGIVEITFDLQNESVNKFNQTTLEELATAVKTVQAQADLKGVLFTSAKDVFVVGADITEFTKIFALGAEAIEAFLHDINGLFNSIEDLAVPTVVAINGVALGGGFELCLSCDYRVAADSAKVGLPEVKLGIHPGWGGSVRLPRLIGVDNANEWICGGSEKTAAAAFKDGAVDAVVPASQLREASLDLLKKVIAGDFDYKARRHEKTTPILLNSIEQMMAFESARGVIGAQAGPHYPAPLQVLKVMQKGVTQNREGALATEIKSFAQLAVNDVTAALVGIFLKDQYVKKVAKQYEKQAQPVEQAAVLGAGIMGGGVAYQSASRGIPILMKDINPQALQLGMDEATKLLDGQLKRGKLSAAAMAKTISQITPTLSYGDFGTTDLVVEAVVENVGIKKKVLAEVEALLKDDAILTSNTSTISINELATALKRPENFCGMHFFNPVHRMPLVEVIRGEKTSPTALARTVAYARAMGKTAIVVNDGPGFLVNRILFPYFGGFTALLRDGADFRRVDKVMEGFGWPMGPAYLLDVVGMDTAHHANSVMADGFPDRMKSDYETAIDKLYALKRLGQKNNLGFYRYELDRKGKPQKLQDPEIDQLLQGVVGAAHEFTDQEIIERMMIPLCIEAARCLEQGIVASPAEADMALIYGIGFPPFRGGAFHYLDQIGLKNFCDMAEKYADLGPLYHPTDKMKAMAATGERYFPQGGQS